MLLRSIISLTGLVPMLLLLPAGAWAQQKFTTQVMIVPAFRGPDRGGAAKASDIVRGRVAGAFPKSELRVISGGDMDDWLRLSGFDESTVLTEGELRELAKKFRSQYLKSPKVTVTITTLRPYYMMGEVKNPGQFAYQSGLNVLTALAIAGGPTYRASRNTVEIQRLGESSMHEYPISASVPILPGDVVKVPERYF